MRSRVPRVIRAEIEGDPGHRFWGEPAGRSAATRTPRRVGWVQRNPFSTRRDRGRVVRQAAVFEF